MSLNPEDRARLEALNVEHLRQMIEGRKRVEAEGSLTGLDALDRNSRAHLVDAMKLCQHRFAMFREEERKVLELGPGNGFDDDYLRSSLDAEYFAVDVVAETAQKTNAVHCAIEDLPREWVEKFNFIYSRHVMEHVIDVDAALASLRHVLASSGIIGAVTPHFFPELDIEPAHVTQLDVPGWTEAYARYGLRVVHSEVVTFRVPEAHIVVIRNDYADSGQHQVA